MCLSGTYILLYAYTIILFNGTYILLYILLLKFTIIFIKYQSNLQLNKRSIIYFKRDEN